MAQNEKKFPTRRLFFSAVGNRVANLKGEILATFSTDGDALTAAGLLNKQVLARAKMTSRDLEFILVQLKNNKPSPDGDWYIKFNKGNPMPASPVEVSLWKQLQAARAELKARAKKPIPA